MTGSSSTRSSGFSGGSRTTTVQQNVSSSYSLSGIFFWAFIYQFVLPLQSVPILVGTNTMVLHTPTIITAVMQTNLMMFSITDVATKNLDYPALIFVTVQIVIGYFILAALILDLGSCSRTSVRLNIYQSIFNANHDLRKIGYIPTSLHPHPPPKKGKIPIIP